MAVCDGKALGREGFLNIRKSATDVWVRIGGVTGLDQSDQDNEIPCDDFDTTGQVPYATDLAEVTMEVGLDYKGRDPGQLMLKAAKNNGTPLFFQYAQEEDPGSDKEMQVGTCTVTTFDRSNAKGELATISSSVRMFNILYGDQTSLTA